MSERVDIAAVAQKQLDAYNAQDLPLYLTFFTDDVVVSDLNGEVSSVGLKAYEERYKVTFPQFPQNKVHLVSRISGHNTVIDYEHVVRGPEGPVFDIIAIYTFRGDKIARVDFAK
jgi:hypothetical protein